MGRRAGRDEVDIAITRACWSGVRETRDRMTTAVDLPPRPARAGSGACDEVRTSHRRLLDGFGALSADAEGDLSALCTFLRQELGQPARREEMCLKGPAGEVAAFEHAFLAVEVEALTRLLSASRPSEDFGSELRRRLHRIEAALEMHVQRLEDDTAALV